jgi:microcystin degradation protein MlrC
MVAEGYDDCEGDLLEKIRSIVGQQAIVGAELDLHCHITEAMLRNATALVAYKEYPHIDILDRAEELFTILADAAEGKTRPTMAAYDCRMIGTFRTTEQPLRGYVDRMGALEGRERVLSVSLGHGFPWGDIADVGMKTLVVTDNDPAKAKDLARRLGEEIFAMREQIRPSFLGMDEALDRALAIEGGPVVIADTSDNSGGGAPGDATFFIRCVRERGITGVASCYYWDPMAVRFCQEAGLGASFELRIGGKCGRSSGDPLDLFVTVRGLAENVTQRFGQAPVNLGSLAWVSAEGLDLVLATQRCQALHPEGMTKLGLDPMRRKIVLVKSTQHFHAGFAPIAKAVLYAAPPGTLQPNYAEIPYTKLTRPYWPKVPDPFRI